MLCKMIERWGKEKEEMIILTSCVFRYESMIDFLRFKWEMRNEKWEEKREKREKRDEIVTWRISTHIERQWKERKEERERSTYRLKVNSFLIRWHNSYQSFIIESQSMIIVKIFFEEILHWHQHRIGEKRRVDQHLFFEDVDQCEQVFLRRKEHSHIDFLRFSRLSCLSSHIEID